MKRTVAGFLFALAVLSAAGASFGDDAAVLPKGVVRARLDSAFYFTVDQRYDDEGHAVPIAKDYNAPLDSSSGLPLPPGLTLGNSVVDIKYDFTILTLGLEYGLTDKLSIGVIIPYWFVESKVNAALDNSTTNMAIAPNGQLVPIFLAPPGSRPVTANDVQKLLGTAFGYQPVQNWSDSDFGDIEAGARYQYYKSDSWRLAFTGGVRFPTGNVDDPDNLVDYETGKGVWALLFRLNNDFTGIKDLVLNASFKYDWTLPDTIEKRVPSDPHKPLTANKENVDRNYGDIYELDVSGKYYFTRTFDCGLQYRYAHKGPDKISGNKGYNYAALEAESAQTEQVYFVSLEYTTVPLYVEKKFAFPMSALLGYRNRFAGQNNLKSSYLSLQLNFYF